jgi:hypothetical protein
MGNVGLVINPPTGSAFHPRHPRRGHQANILMDLYSGLTFNTEEDRPHLGGNVDEGDPLTFSPKVWEYLINRFSLRSLLDLGCGLGYSSEFFFRHGIRTIAVDGLPTNIKRSVYPSLLIDLTMSPVVCNVDLVHCQEVVEHVEEKYLNNVLLSLCCGKFIVMTHALPGDEGHHHVNCQPHEYWIQHLESRGCNFLPTDTDRIRSIAQSEGAFFMAQSGLIFVNRKFSKT